MKTINNYEFNKGITRELLEEVGFTNRNPKYLYYGRKLYEEIYLIINIPVDESEIDLDEADITVLDEEFGQPYTPFYYDSDSFPFLDMVIDSYNYHMDKLTDDGIFKKAKTKTLTK